MFTKKILLAISLVIGILILKLYTSNKKILMMLLVLEVVMMSAMIMMASSHFCLFSLSFMLTVFTVSVGEASLALGLLINFMRKTSSSLLTI